MYFKESEGLECRVLSNLERNHQKIEFLNDDWEIESLIPKALSILKNVKNECERSY